MNILAIIYKVVRYFTGELAKENYYSIAWAFSRACIAGIAAMVFIICSMNMNYYFGILGSTLTVLSTTLNTHANFAIVDVPMAFFVTLFFLALTIFYTKIVWGLEDIILIALIVGIAIAMKYTAALLIPVLFFISTQYVQKNRKFVLPVKIIKKVLFYLGMFLLMVFAMIKINQQSLLDYFTGLTTDGILEIEYIRTLSNFSIYIMILGITFILFSLWTKLVQNEWTGFIISPFHLFTIFTLIIGYILFSPFTLIEFKKSFIDFMYEYRHMNIGSAAQYHHLSDEYRTIVSNLSSTASAVFYINLIHHNMGTISIIFFLCGIYSMYLQKPAYTISMTIYLVFLLVTLFTWKNFAVRYTLSIFPIIIIFTIQGVFMLCNEIKKRFSVNQIIMECLISISILIHPLANIFKHYGKF